MSACKKCGKPAVSAQAVGEIALNTASMRSELCFSCETEWLASSDRIAALESFSTTADGKMYEARLAEWIGKK